MKKVIVKCKLKNPLKNFITKTTKKDCTLQNYIFSDTKGDEIQATCFGKTADNLDKLIQEGGIYEIKKMFEEIDINNLSFVYYYYLNIV